MMCTNQTWVRLPGQTEKQPVACRKCMPCRVKRAREWSIRLNMELKDSTSAMFLTLTYDDEHIVRNDLGHGILIPKHTQNFMKQLRAKNAVLTKAKIRFYLVGEYGGESFRPHYHAIIFNIHANLKPQISDIWKKGFITHDEVNETTINYVTKYITKVDTRSTELMELPPQFARMSRNPGLGDNYINDKTIKYHDKNGRRTTIHKGDKKIKLPEYIIRKLNNNYASETDKTLIQHEKAKLNNRTERLIKARNDQLRADGIDPDRHIQALTEQQIKQLEKRNKRNKL